MSNWRDEAKCRDEDPEIFFPPGSIGPIAIKAINKAKAVCHNCPVTQNCLAEALHPSKYKVIGIWGGTTDDERRKLRRWQQDHGRVAV